MAANQSVCQPDKLEHVHTCANLLSGHIQVQEGSCLDCRQDLNETNCQVEEYVRFRIQIQQSNLLITYPCVGLSVTLLHLHSIGVSRPSKSVPRQTKECYTFSEKCDKYDRVDDRLEAWKEPFSSSISGSNFHLGIFVNSNCKAYPATASAEVLRACSLLVHWKGISVNMLQQCNEYLQW